MNIDSLKNDHLLKGLRPVKGLTPYFRLRWVFRWADGRYRCGMWNGATNKFEDTAASINKTGLLYAGIQGLLIQHSSEPMFFECDGHDYVAAKWIGATSTGAPVGKWAHDAYTLTPDIIGLAFLTRYERVSVFVDGSLSRRQHTEHEKNFKLREHSV